MTENEKEKKYVSEDELIEDMRTMFLKPYLKEMDSQLAYAVGLYLQVADYYQQDVLQTAGLQKKLRPLIDFLDQHKLEKIFNECNKVFFHIKTKTRETKIRFDKLRVEVEKLLLEVTDWSSSSEKLSICFFMGYDAYGRLYRQKYLKE